METSRLLLEKDVMITTILSVPESSNGILPKVLKRNPVDHVNPGDILGSDHIV